MTATAQDRRRWAKHLVNERAEAHVYRELAGRREGEERQILLALAEAEGRHESHWLELLGEEPARLPRPDFRTVTLAWMARRFGSIFVLALAQNAEARSPYAADPDATAAMAADESVHLEVVRGLAARGRRRLSGTFRAAVFGANDGLVSNLALVLGIGATGVSATFVMFSGLAGLLAGALSMGAGEYVSVRSQQELLATTAADGGTDVALGDLDLNANELALVYRARGMSEQDARVQADRAITTARGRTGPVPARIGTVDEDVVGTPWRAAFSSFLFFASGAIIPVLPWLLGGFGWLATVWALLLVGVALMCTGALVGILSGASPLKRGLRQLAIGYGAAAVTYLLGLLFGVG